MTSADDIDLGIDAQGPKGDKGDQGPQGPAGPKGDSGKSAYQVWLDSGHTGTQTDFLNFLKGPKGDKGDTGTVDNAGLTTAPAFVKLQTQVNNSAVGTNLLMGTRDWRGDWKNLPLWMVSEETYRGLTVRYRDSAWSSLAQYYDADPNTTYTFSFYAKASEADNSMVIFVLDSDDWSSPVVSRPDYVGQTITTEWQRYSVTFTTKSGGKICPNACTGKDGITIYTAGYKLEKGSVATDWCPNPAEIMTQADRGLSIWFNKNAYGGNLQGKWWSDLYNTKVGFGPQVGDLVIQPNGMITQVTAVNDSGDASQGGGTFDIGAVIGNMQGHTPVRGTDYWTDADKNEIKSYVNDAILKGKW